MCCDGPATRWEKTRLSLRAHISRANPGDVVSLYRRQMDAIVAVRRNTNSVSDQPAAWKNRPRKSFASIRRPPAATPRSLAFELGQHVRAQRRDFRRAKLFLGLMDIPEIKGLKHSSLDRLVELERLSLRDAHRPDFRIYTGNDLGINMIEYGSDYLLGLATFAPEKFAETRRLWEQGDAGYYALSDALQYLGNVAFREPVPAYKHSAAVFLQLIGSAPSSLTHPRNIQRPAWEGEMLRDCARRLGCEVLKQRSPE